MASAADDTAVEKENWHWRNTMRPVRFFNLDARAAFPFFVLLVYLRPISLVITLLITVFFYILERYGLTFPASLRAIRLWLGGDFRPGHYRYAFRTLKDFG